MTLSKLQELKQQKWLFLTALLLLLTTAVFQTGCSGESKPKPIFDIPVPAILTITGNIDLSNVAIHRDLSGINSSMLDMSPFVLSIEDSLLEAVSADYNGKFSFEPIVRSEQIVVRCEHSLHKNLVLEWMAADSKGLAGDMKVTIDIMSTARSMISRCLKDVYGRRIRPEALLFEHINPTVEAIANVLERYPEKIATSPLDQVPDIKLAYSDMAKALNDGESGTYPNELVLMIYMAADNSLSSYIADSLESISKTKLPINTQIVIQADLPIDGCKRLIHNGSGTIELKNLGNIDSSNGEVLSDFIAWCRRNLPAKRYALLISSHGNGWRSLIVDDETGTEGNPIEIATAIKSGLTAFNNEFKPLELLVFDASSMASIEIAWEFKNLTKYTILSQAKVPGMGFPITKIIDKINDSGIINLTDKNIGSLFCDQYRLRYIDSPVETLTTVSMIENSEFDDFKQKLNAYFSTIYLNINTYETVIAKLRDSLMTSETEEGVTPKYLIQSFENTDYRDLKDFVNKAKESISTAKSEADRLLEVYDNLVVENHASRFFPDAYGLSISLPATASYEAEYGGSLITHYKDLAFCENTLWDEILAEIYSSESP